MSFDVVGSFLKSSQRFEKSTLPWWTHAQRLREVESHVNGIADLHRENAIRTKVDAKVGGNFSSYLLNCTLGQEVWLLVVWIIMVLGRLNARLE